MLTKLDRWNETGSSVLRCATFPEQFYSAQNRFAGLFAYGTSREHFGIQVAVIQSGLHRPTTAVTIPKKRFQTCPSVPPRSQVDGKNVANFQRQLLRRDRVFYCLSALAGMRFCP